MKPKFSVDAVYRFGVLAAYHVVSDQGDFSAPYEATEEGLQQAIAEVDFQNTPGAETRVTVYP